MAVQCSNSATRGAGDVLDGKRNDWQGGAGTSGHSQQPTQGKKTEWGQGKTHLPSS